MRIASHKLGFGGRWAKLVGFALMTTLASGCYGGVFGSPRVDVDKPDQPDDPPSNAGETGGIPEEEAEAPFVIPGDEVKLLPFSVRLRNLATLVDVPTDSPIFDVLHAQRVPLGAHDYASGIAADLRWSPDRMHAWVKAIQPVCKSAEFAARYPTLLDDPTPLLRMTLGREPTPEDVASLDDAMVADLPPDARYQLVCLAALSSLEFVAM